MDSYTNLFWTPIFYGLISFPVFVVAVVVVAVFYFVRNYLHTKQFAFNLKIPRKPIEIILALWVIIVLVLSVLSLTTQNMAFY